ncbi:MAG: DUF4238 domain-containing protein [Aulosira sp. ZfuVER01]|nr:DUF4238 domain-containing protein [Aulosira sp. ZfuVER01]MDZ8002731.1 DUF4238 domain-containing protein [Aulosira sp. DedVER01a]MDZ8050591.1 DUF4238 domain-containing protein [Aulosira sp. ZfuCHP01]
MEKNYNHHYVPQSILKNFAYKQQTVYSLIKVEELPIYPINITNICQERSFYEINIKTSDSEEIEKINYDIEVFEKLDSEIAPIIKNIIANEEIKGCIPVFILL